MIKRISFYIDHYLNDEFEKRADSLGVTKSTLLKKWIAISHSIQIESKSFHKKSQLFTFRIDDDLYRLICIKAAHFKLTHSEYLRSLITTHLNPLKITVQNDPDTKTPVFDLWRRGLHNKLNEFVGCNIEKLSNQELLHYANANLEFGGITNTDSAIMLIKERADILPEGSAMSQFYYIIKADAAIKDRRLAVGDSALRAFEDMPNKELNRTALGYYYLLKGELRSYQDRLEEALECYNNAVDYLDLINHPWLLIRVYIRIGRFWKYRMDFSTADYYFKRAREINKKADNVYFGAWNRMDKGFLEYVQNKFDDSTEDTKKGMELYKITGNIRGNYYGYDNLGRVALSQGKIDTAYTYLTKALEIEKKFRNPEVLSYSKLFKWFIEAKDNYERSKTQFEVHSRKGEFTIWPGLTKYMYYTTKFLKGKNDGEVNDGEFNLKILAREGSYNLIKNAARRTLETRYVQPVT